MGLGRLLHGAESPAGYLVDHLAKPIRLEDRLGQKNKVGCLDDVRSGPDVSVMYLDHQSCMD